ncbi:3-oxoadipate enol-lactonase 2 [Methyloligella halotolerans]|uniref:3-oxoadipate enol-lactonase 2 n=1 Tax=Methyloligella halotolerans TaxID=1177755 RepID=A0A1E2RYV5_9HYPH|nr:alpha/beta hydrolase [Methyloligella halotolerans]ODA67417.1 3-oxoadipate enol-lactonase 2 [Methyloligella halotolerans]
MAQEDTEQTPVNINFRKATGSKWPVVLIHGWCGDHSFLSEQFSHYAPAGHTVVTMDLRGHGKSDKPDAPYTMQAFADDIALLLADLQIRRPILIGHGMGGIIGFEIGMRYPHLAAAVVMLDSAAVLPDSKTARVGELLEALRGEDYRETLRDYAEDILFLEYDDPVRKERLLDVMAATPQHVMISCLENLQTYEPGGHQRELPVPCLYLATRESCPPSEMSRFEAAAPHMIYGKTVGAGHFCQIEIPNQVNTMIDRFLTLALR